MPYFCFHDVDIAPERRITKEFHSNVNHITDFFEKEMESAFNYFGERQIYFPINAFVLAPQLTLTQNCFAYAAAQVKYVMDVTHRLGGENYVLWGRT